MKMETHTTNLGEAEVKKIELIKILPLTLLLLFFEGLSIFFIFFAVI